MSPAAPFVSHAQNMEDVMLWRALGHVRAGCYVDIGAAHPDVASVSLAFYRQGWRGTHVEPLPLRAAELVRARPDEVVIEAAIGCGEGPITFFDIAESNGISTGRASLAQQYEAEGLPVRLLEVAQRPLSAVLDACGEGPIHWLKIDVEGAEAEVIRSWLPSPVRPWVVLVESTRPRSQEPSFAEWEPMLLALGYRFAWFDGLNRFYVSEAQLSLLSAFNAPPNVFDGFVLCPGHELASPAPVSVPVPMPMPMPPSRVALVARLRRLAARLLRGG